MGVVEHQVGLGELLYGNGFRGARRIRRHVEDLVAQQGANRQILVVDR
jgi:hypothetical protein